MPAVPQLPPSKPMPISKHRVFEGPQPPPVAPKPVPGVPALRPGLTAPGRTPMPAAEMRPPIKPGELPPVPQLPKPKYEPVTVDAKGFPRIPESYRNLRHPDGRAMSKAEVDAIVQSETTAALRRAADYKRYARAEFVANIKRYLDNSVLALKSRREAYRLGAASPTALEGIMAISALSILYLLLTGRKPQTNRPQVAQIVEGVTSDVTPPTPVTIEMRTALQNANSAISSAVADPKLDPAAKQTLPTYIQLLRDIDSDIAALAGTKLSLNNAASANVYVSEVKRTEAALLDKMRHLEQLKAFFAGQAMNPQVLAIDNLMGSISKFLMMATSSRGMA